MAGWHFFRTDSCDIDPKCAQKHCRQRFPAGVDEKAERVADLACPGSSEIFAGFVTGDFACSDFTQCFACAGFWRGCFTCRERAASLNSQTNSETVKLLTVFYLRFLVVFLQAIGRVRDPLAALAGCEFFGE